ncbi:hypothetical protein M388_00235 [Mesotoga sp. Brook.08.YT.4.2.5.4.]|nr:hypothetical protein M388_00235 [Mesotoga sp. Brook.08.YT.4.2.5.4.]
MLLGEVHEINKGLWHEKRNIWINDVQIEISSSLKTQVIGVVLW